MSRINILDECASPELRAELETGLENDKFWPGDWTIVEIIQATKRIKIAYVRKGTERRRVLEYPEGCQVGDVVIPKWDGCDVTSVTFVERTP